MLRLRFKYNQDSGFYECSRCRFTFPDWNIGEDSIVRQHQEFQSDCPCVVHIRNEGTDDVDDVDSGSYRQQAVYQLRDLPNNDITRKSKFPQMASKQARMESFSGHEYRYSRSDHPDIIEQLVEAGFYYKGPTDNVRCFHCDGGLKNFLPGDKPLEEHQKYFHECEYIKYVEKEKLDDRHRLNQELNINSRHHGMDVRKYSGEEIALSGALLGAYDHDRPRTQVKSSLASSKQLEPGENFCLEAA